MAKTHSHVHERWKNWVTIQRGQVRGAASHIQHCHPCEKSHHCRLFKWCSGWGWREIISDMTNVSSLTVMPSKIVDTLITRWTLLSNHQSSMAVKSILVNSGTHPRLETIKTPNPTYCELKWIGQTYFILKTSCKNCSVWSKHSLPSGKLSKKEIKNDNIEVKKRYYDSKWEKHMPVFWKGNYFQKKVGK